ncbi:MAG: hypothetical protein Q9168_001167 [Polycauliona sp. 1 TL-2023]
MSVPTSSIRTSSKGPSTYPVQICFASPGAQPPVFVAGSFTLPEWHPRELQCSLAEQDNFDTEYVFHGTFHLPPGTYQYKFRLGHEGDWWVCDHNVDIGTVLPSSPQKRFLLISHTVTDALGNQNNRLIVTGLPSEPRDLDSAAAAETLCPEDTAQTSATSPVMNRLDDLSNEDEGDRRMIEQESPAIHDKGQALTPSASGASLRRRKEISVDPSHSSSKESSTPPATRGNLLRLLLGFCQSIWTLLFRREAR